MTGLFLNPLQRYGLFVRIQSTRRVLTLVKGEKVILLRLLFALFEDGTYGGWPTAGYARFARSPCLTAGKRRSRAACGRQSTHAPVLEEGEQLPFSLAPIVRKILTIAISVMCISQLRGISSAARSLIVRTRCMAPCGHSLIVGNDSLIVAAHTIRLSAHSLIVSARSLIV